MDKTIHNETGKRCNECGQVVHDDLNTYRIYRMQRFGATGWREINMVTIPPGESVYRYRLRLELEDDTPVRLILVPRDEFKIEDESSSQRMYDAAIEAVEHVAVANWNSREEAAKRWLELVKNGDTSKSLDQVQKEVNNE